MQIIKDTFHLLLKAKTCKEVDQIHDQLKIPKKYRMETRYPNLHIKVNKEEIKELIKAEIIDDHYNLKKINIDADPVARLLYALLWKTGDLVKLKPIIAGILADDGKKNSGLVYQQFGRFLSGDSAEPIIDQHIIRAFGIFQAGDNLENIRYYQQLTNMTRQDLPVIDDYKYWIRNEPSPSLRSEPDYTYAIDKVLFAVGKMVKV